MVPDVVILILTWNHQERTFRCLESVVAQDYPSTNLQIIVVDNASTDNTVPAVQSAFPQTQLIVNPINLGYAAGNNVGLRYAMAGGNPKYIFIVNNDVILGPSVLKSLVAAGEENPTAGFLGPKIYQSDDPQHIQSAGTVVTPWGGSYQRGLDQLDDGQFDVQCEVDAIVGCATLIRVDVLRKIGLLDERFYLYHEDIDWCIRARKAGFKILYVPDAKIWHRSSNTRESDLPYMMYYMTRNTYLMLQKNSFGRLAIIRYLLQHVIWIVNWTINPKWWGKSGQRNAVLKALFDVSMGNYGQQAHNFWI